MYPRYARSFRTHIENVTVYAPEGPGSRSQISIAVNNKETVEFSYRRGAGGYQYRILRLGEDPGLSIRIEPEPGLTIEDCTRFYYWTPM